MANFKLQWLTKFLSQSEWVPGHQCLLLTCRAYPCFPALGTLFDGTSKLYLWGTPSWPWVPSEFPKGSGLLGSISSPRFYPYTTSARVWTGPSCSLDQTSLLRGNPPAHSPPLPHRFTCPSLSLTPPYHDLHSNLAINLWTWLQPPYQAP